MSVDLDTSHELVVLRAVSEPLRWRIVEMLGQEELCVCHLVEELGVTQSLVSHHLKVLANAGVVGASRSAYWTYYRLEPEPLAQVRDLLGRLSSSASTVDSRRPCC